jgi:hypothetical protein
MFEFIYNKDSQPNQKYLNYIYVQMHLKIIEYNILIYMKY